MPAATRCKPSRSSSCAIARSPSRPRSSRRRARRTPGARAGSNGCKGATNITRLGLMPSVKARVRRLRVVIADDHPSIRENLRYLLNAEPDLDVVGVARDGTGAVQMSLELRPDVLVVDYDLPDHDGLSVARALREKGFTARVVPYTLDSEVWAHAEESRVDACVSKDAPPEVLFESIRGSPSGATDETAGPDVD